MSRDFDGYMQQQQMSKLAPVLSTHLAPMIEILSPLSSPKPSSGFTNSRPGFDAKSLKTRLDTPMAKDYVDTSQHMWAPSMTNLNEDTELKDAQTMVSIINYLFVPSFPIGN